MKNTAMSFALILNTFLFFLVSSGMVQASVIHNGVSSMSKLDPEFERLGINIRFPAVLFFEQTGKLVEIRYSSYENSAFSENLSAADHSFNDNKTIHYSDLIEFFEFPANSQPQQPDVLMLTIDNQLCGACKTEKKALISYLESNESLQAIIVKVEFR